MKQLLRYSFLTSVALIVAACGQTPSGNGGGQQAQNGLLEVVVEGVAQAPVTVSGANGAVFTGAVSGTKDLTLPAGTYFVDGAPTSGFRDPSPLSVTVGANQTVKAFVPYQAAPPPSGNVASVTIQSVSDASGALPAAWEGNSNPVKPVGLYAAQTEEPVVVQVRATDAGGAPVSNANVVVNLSELFGDHVAIIRGAATSMLGTMSKAAIKPLAFRDGITTDANGIATFTLFATYGASPASLESELLMFNQPAKIVVAAENGNATSVLNEFKVFFYNITHLYFTEGGSEQYTGQRLGKVFTLTNLFKPATVTDLTHGDMLVNTFTGGVSLYQKQPRTRIGDSMDSLLPDGGTFLLTYTLDDTTHFHFVPGSYGTVLKSDPSGNPMVVTNNLAGQIKIAPNDAIGLMNLPLTANVHVQLWVSAFYGDEGNSLPGGIPPFDGTTTGASAPYWFSLKDFTIHKTWIGSFLSITKTVDHHVLTWAGPEHHIAFVADPAHPEVNTLDDSHTLASSNDPAVTAGSVFTSTITLTLKNQGTDPVYNVTLADALPAELGVITSTANPSGATYDANTHVITWNDQNTGLPIFNTLAPGASITATFQVYLRQKPGFAMDRAAYLKALGYEVKPIILGGGRYPDPYQVVNGDKVNDVTGTWFTGAPLGQGGWQAKVDFDGNLHSADVVVNGVRPIYTLAKTITYQPTVPASVGDVIYYHIHAVNTERTDPGDPYAALATMYPNEFDGTVRDNPYGRNVRITDVMDNGLDYVSASPLTLTNDETNAVAATYAPNQYLDKGIYWNLVPLMQGGDMLDADIQLRADLPSASSIILNAVQKMTPADIIVERPYWWNCAFLDADNLNQPWVDANVQPWQTEKRPWGDHTDRAVYNILTFGLQSCVPVGVILPGQPFLEPTLRGEFTTNDPLKTPDQDVRVGDHYFLQYEIRNNGEVAAIDVRSTLSLSYLTGTGQHAAFTDMTASDYLVLRSNDGMTWTPTAIQPTSVTADTVTFPPLPLNPGAFVLYIAPITATSVGTELNTAMETYSNHGAQLDPLTSTDPTNIGPADLTIIRTSSHQ